MKKRFLFIMPPHQSDLLKHNYAKWRLSRIPPYGLITIASYLNHYGYKSMLIDCRDLIERHCTTDYIAIIEKYIKTFRPDFIGLGLLTANIPQTQVITNSIRLHFPHIPLIVGGVQPTVEPHLTLDLLPAIDAVCVGEGEDLCIDICERGALQADIPGLLLRGSEDKHIDRNLNVDLDRLPFPNSKCMPIYFYTTPSAYTTFGWLTRSFGVLTSRGCPFSCKFCGGNYNKPMRMHSAAYVEALVRHVAGFGIDTIAFWDDTIACNQSRIIEICERLARTRLFKPFGRLRWRCSLRANQVTSELLKLMKRAGCYHIAVGIESGSDRILKIMDKRTTVELNRKACELIKDAGLDLGVSFMIGVPEETEEDILQTLAFMRQVGPVTIGCGNFRPLPGSLYYAEMIADGRLQHETINWQELGDFSCLPKRLFCKIERERFESYYSEALKIAYGKYQISVFRDIAVEIPDVVDDIKKNINLRVV